MEALTGLAQGTTYTLQWWTATPADTAVLRTDVGLELERLDALLSNYRSDSVLETFNAKQTLDPITLPAELVDLLRIAAAVHAASDGCFDPTVRPLVRLWGFDGTTPSVPSDAAIEATLPDVGLDKLVILDAQHVRKTVPALAIDMASIGQGYTVARLAAVFERRGIENYLVEIGGELAARGAKPDGKPWRVGIADPRADDEALETLEMPVGHRTAVVTSGSYRHWLERDGHVYSHIIDPRTGRAVDHDLVSVTVVGSNAAIAAAWGTALLCLGPTQAPVTADRNDIAAAFVVRDGAKRLTLLHSHRFPENRLDRAGEPR